jgi:predicted DNA-binding transcriptional regulator AlpA
MRNATNQRTPETTTHQQPLLVGQPWRYLGLSRSAWYRLLSSGQAPPPVPLPGSRPRWRRADLDSWVARLKPTGRRRAPANGQIEAN